MARVPVTLEVGVRTFFCGPESFTPDLAPAVGEAPGIRNYFVAAGMNSVGILSAGGLGRVLAHWITTGRPGRRRHRLQRRPVPRRGRPTTPTAPRAPPRSSARCTPRTRRASSCAPPATRCSPRSTTGWSSRAATCARCPAGRAPTGSPAPGATPSAEPTWGRAPWFEQWEAEHRAVREGVGLMDMSFMAKFRVAGRRRRRGARPGLGRRRERDDRDDHLHPVARRGRPDRGRPDRHQAGRGRLLRGRLRHRARPRAGLAGAGTPATPTCTVTDVTADYAQLNVQGPRSREVLAELHRRRPVDRGVRRSAPPAGSRSPACEVLCARITYLGELGYELYVPADRRAERVRRAAGRRGGVRPAAGRAQGAGLAADGEGLPRLRPRHRQHRLPARGRARLRARAGQAGRLRRPRRGAGPQGRQRRGRRDAPAAGAGPGARPRAAAVPRRGRAPRRRGRSATSGRRRTAGRSARAVGLAFVSGGGEPVTAGLARRPGTWEVDIAGTRHPVEVSLRPMYDPTSARVRA